MNIPLFRILWDDEDVESVSNVVRRGTYWTTGPNTVEFEKRLSEYVGTKYCVTFNSGTSALHSALIAHGIGAGDEVIVPSFTFIATANSPLFTGAKPVFADIEKKTLGLDPEKVKEKITKRTKAIIPVHYGGSSCLIRELKEVAEDHQLILIEDAAESLGGMVNGRKVGTTGDSAMFSFCQNKVITTGDGGCIVTDSKEVYEKLKLVRSHGRLETGNYFASTEYMDYVTLGYNFRMSDIAAALGVSQLNKIDRIIEMRRKNAEYMTGRMSGIPGVEPPKPPQDYFHIYQMYTIRVMAGAKTRDALITHLSGKGIGVKVYFYPIHLTQFYRREFGYKKGDLPHTEQISGQVLSLPMFPKLTKDEMNYVVDELRDYLLSGPK